MRDVNDDNGQLLGNIMKLNISKPDWLKKPSWLKIPSWLASILEFVGLFKITPISLKSFFIFHAIIFILSTLSIFEVGFAESMTLVEAIAEEKLGFFEGFLHGYFIILGWLSSFFFETTTYALNSTPDYNAGFGLGMFVLVLINAINRAVNRAMER